MSQARYTEVRQLAQGGYGVVKMCFDNKHNTWVAIKQIDSRTLKREAIREARELHIMKHFHHEQIITLLDVYTDPPNPSPHSDFTLNIVMPMLNGDLRAHIRDRLILPSNQSDPTFLHRTAVVIAFQILFALDHLHESAVIHRDLKPENILVTIDILNCQNTKAVLTDFGLARHVAAEHQTQYVCSRNYRPPEAVTMTSVATPSFDIWSVGCIFYELLTGTPLFTVRTGRNSEGNLDPILASRQLETILDIIGSVSPQDIQEVEFENVRSYLRKTENRKRELENKLRSHISIAAPQEEVDLWVDLISSCVQYNPNRRPTARALLRHKLFYRHGLRFGDNIHQEEPNPYVQPDRISNAKEALGTLLQMVKEFVTTADLAEQLLFPEVSEELQRKYAHWDLSTSESVQNAITTVIDDMAASTDMTRTQHLQLVLNFFVAVIPVDPPADTDQLVKIRVNEDFPQN